MADCEIRCITKSPSQGGHEHITHAGNRITSDWYLTVEQVIQSIDAHTNTFYVMDHMTGKRANVGVVRPAHSRAYIRTYADGVWTDNSCHYRRARNRAVEFTCTSMLNFF